MNIVLLLGILSNCILILGKLLFIYGVIKKNIIPHAFSWLVWTALVATAFGAQLAGGGGIGAVITGVNALFCFIFFLLSLKYGVKKFVFLDWLALALCAIGFAAWQVTNNPLWATIIVSVTDFLAFFPTFRKTYLNPSSDKPLPYTLDSVGYAISLFTLASYSVTTWLYPVAVITMNLAFVAMLLVLGPQPPKTQSQ